MQIRGIDFSGGQRPGTDIWIAEGRLEAGTLRIDRCQSATERFDETGREAILRALRETLTRKEGTTGLDFSFGLPAALLPDDVETWGDATGWFARAFADADATEMREQLKSDARSLQGDGVELKRRTDRTVGASSPYSFITYYQTLYGIRDVLAPLVEAGTVAVPPLESPSNRNVIEIYPAGTLRRLGTADTKYKDGASNAERRRERIVDRLTDPDPGIRLELPTAVRKKLLEEPGGDALDSVVAAVATARAVDRGFEPERPFDAREGYIHV